jgi:hypothetical protein
MDWTCEICGKDTSNIEYDYLDGRNHLACVLGVWGGHNSLKKSKKMKIKGWEKISGYTYKGYTIVNPIHNADETKYEATILNLNLPQKPKWELHVLTPAHKFKQDNVFSISMWNDQNFLTRRQVTIQRMRSISIFRNEFEEMVDEILAVELTSALTPNSHSIQMNTGGASSGIINKVTTSGTNIVLGTVDNGIPTHIDLIATIKELQNQIDELKQNTPSNPF